jgi:hypothetical protein
MNVADNIPEMAIASISYAEEIDHLVDDLLILQRSTPRIDAGELVIVATCRNHVWDALAALLTHAVGPFRRRPALRSIADLQSAPAAFALDTLRSYPRLPTDSAPAPSDLPQVPLRTPTAIAWRHADRHATLAAHTVDANAAGLPTRPGDPSLAALDLAAIITVAAGLDRRLEEAYIPFAALDESYNPMPGSPPHAHCRSVEQPRDVAVDCIRALQLARRTGIVLIVSELARQHAAARAGTSWDVLRARTAPAGPLVISSARDVAPGLSRLTTLLAAGGSLDSSGMAAVARTLAETSHALSRAYAVRVGRIRTRSSAEDGPYIPTRYTALGEAHRALSLHLVDLYRQRSAVASLVAGDRRPVMQAGEIHRALAHDDIPSLALRDLARCTLAMAGAVPALHTSLAKAFDRGDLLVHRRPPERGPEPEVSESATVLWVPARQLDAPVAALEASRRAALAGDLLQRLVRSGSLPAGRSTGARNYIEACSPSGAAATLAEMMRVLGGPHMAVRSGQPGLASRRPRPMRDRMRPMLLHRYSAARHASL